MNGWCWFTGWSSCSSEWTNSREFRPREENISGFPLLESDVSTKTSLYWAGDWIGLVFQNPEIHHLQLYLYKISQYHLEMSTPRHFTFDPAPMSFPLSLTNGCYRDFVVGVTFQVLNETLAAVEKFEFSDHPLQVYEWWNGQWGNNNPRTSGSLVAQCWELANVHHVQIRTGIYPATTFCSFLYPIHSGDLARFNTHFFYV